MHIVMFVGFFAYDTLDTLLSCLLLKQLCLFFQNILKSFFYLNLKKGLSTWCGSGGLRLHPGNLILSTMTDTGINQ